MSFRKKIFLSQCILILALVTILLPAIGALSSFILKNLYTDQVDIGALKRAFDVIAIGVCITALLINGFLIMMIINRVIRPIQQIIDAIGPFKEGKEEFLPRIRLSEQIQEGEFSRLASTINSLSDRIQKQIEYLTRQREETEEILESLGEGVIAADPSAKITFANGTACRMLGLPSECIVGKSLDQIASDDLARKCHELIVDALQTSEPNTHMWTVREKALLYLNLISAPLAHKDGALLVLQDKTSEYKVIELGKDFIANASHELRTPITIIRGFAETLQDVPDLSQKVISTSIEKIVKMCGRLDKLVRNLLTLSDIENFSDERFIKLDLLPLLENCTRTLLMVNPEAKLSIQSSSESATIYADGDLLELAIMNILENAVKYSKDSAQIKLTVELDQEDVHLKIKDAGIGIPEKDLPLIFERFYTVDKARSRKSGGTGLGLSIVKTIIEKHQGKILAKSTVNQGSSFTFIFPKKLKKSQVLLPCSSK